MANKAKPFAVEIPVRFQGGRWQPYQETGRNGLRYTWYRVVGTKARMIGIKGAEMPSTTEIEPRALSPRMLEMLDTWEKKTGRKHPRMERHRAEKAKKSPKETP